MVALPALVSGLDAELVRLGYKDSTMVWYRGCWRRMQKYFAARGVEEFSLDVAMAWVDAACGFFGKEQSGALGGAAPIFAFGEQAIRGRRRGGRAVPGVASRGRSRRVDGARVRDGGRG